MTFRAKWRTDDELLSRPSRNRHAEADAHECSVKIVPDWALVVARRWTDNMVGGMKRVGLKVGDPSEHMYRATAVMILEAMPKVYAAAPEMAEALLPIAAAYPDDPGTSDLDNEQPVTITLRDVRRAWQSLRKAGISK